MTSTTNTIVLVAAVFLTTAIVTFIRLPESASNSTESPVPPALTSQADKHDLEAPETELSTEPDTIAGLLGLKPPVSANANSAGTSDGLFADPVLGNPLAVTVPWLPEIGEISIESFDSNGNPTGKPLKTGTTVYIQNPTKPGEQLYFIVP